MKKIIVISGKQYSGKDTVAKILLEHLKGFRRIGIGDAIKLEYASKNNLTFDEIEKNKHLYRKDLINLGNLGRAKDKYYWLNALSQMENIIVPDIRVQDEVEFFKNKGAYLIRVESSYENRLKRGVIVEADDNTETALDDYPYWDKIIDNNSDYNALTTKVQQMLRDLP